MVVGSFDPEKADGCGEVNHRLILGEVAYITALSCIRDTAKPFNLLPLSAKEMICDFAATSATLLLTVKTPRGYEVLLNSLDTLLNNLTVQLNNAGFMGNAEEPLSEPMMDLDKVYSIFYRLKLMFLTELSKPDKAEVDIMVQLVQIGSTQGGALTTENGIVWYPANTMLSAAKEISELREALIWCGGASDFSPEGKARAGYVALCDKLLHGKRIAIPDTMEMHLREKVESINMSLDQLADILLKLSFLYDPLHLFGAFCRAMTCRADLYKEDMDASNTEENKMNFAKAETLSGFLLKVKIGLEQFFAGLTNQPLL